MCWFSTLSLNTKSYKYKPLEDIFNDIRFGWTMTIIIGIMYLAAIIVTGFVKNFTKGFCLNP